MTRKKSTLATESIGLYDALAELQWAGFSEEEIESNIEGGNAPTGEDDDIVLSKASYIAYKFTQGIEARYSGKDKCFYLYNL